MFNTPFPSNFQGFPFGFTGYQGFQGFTPPSPSWNQSFGNQFGSQFGNQYTPFSGYQGQNWNSSPWSAFGYQGNNWDWNTPQNWYAPSSFQGFQGFDNGYQGQSWNTTPWAFNGSPNYAQAYFPFAGQNWFNTPFASQYGQQFNQSPFGYNWWNAEADSNEAAASTYPQTPFGYNPFAGFNPNTAPATQAA